MPPRRRSPVRQMQDESVNNDRDPVDPMQRFVDLLVGAMENRNPRADNPNPPPTHLANFKDFKLVGPPEFRGTTNPIEAQTWIMEIEQVFEVARVAEEQKTAFATFMMKGDAGYWWQANKTRGGGGVIAWDRFKEMFFETYFPPCVQDKMEVQFLELKQGNMSVSEYAAKFNELARFAPHQVCTDERKAKRFEQGLKPWIYSRVSMFQIKTFAAVLEKAILAEGGSEAIIKYNQDRKGKFNGSEEVVKERSSGGSNPSKRKWISTNTGDSQGEARKRGEACGSCGKHHPGECMKGRSVCFNCGQEGHISPNCPNPKKIKGCFACGSTEHQIRNCPKKGRDGGSEIKGVNNNKLTIEGPTQFNRPTARTFNMTVQDAMASRGVIPGIMLIRNVNVYI